ncbi:MAG TPA: elongation factor P maturation arginine rhamnosyltransferase EarP [Casimicrobiaceae bacterium]|nr:elongation factor P maturation arginine rhamnosyltransferase EarP [Casimicrobiaceae bacterium]
MNGRRWDVYCRVVDNYGDAGVAWRLARQLASEHALDVTMWIDRIATLARFEPALDPRAPTQWHRGVTVRVLDETAGGDRLPDVVVEAFGCGLPEGCLDAMEASERPPLWFNLEYLSAEPWVDTVHGLASPLPQRALTRYFWFPGFTPRTGGLIREMGLLQSRDRYLHDLDARSLRDGAREARGGRSDALRLVLFCYPSRALPALFDAWAEGDEAIVCTVPDGVATAALDAWLHGDVPHAGQSVTHGRLTLSIRPFSTQEEFDRLLWASEVNFVRGEDSFVRAQWAARAFVWQPYPQDERAHVLKLEAFVDRYTAEMPGVARGALLAFWRAFNAEDGAAAAAAWPAFRAASEALRRHGLHWAGHLASLPDLAAGLVEFTQRRL